MGRKATGAFLVLVALAGCGRRPGNGDSESGIARPEATAEQVAAIAESNLRFAVDLHNATSDGKPSRFASPFSVYSAMAGAYSGAAGKTADEIKSALHYPAEPAEIGAYFAGVLTKVKRNRKGVDLRIANRLFGHAASTFKPEFLKAYQFGFHGEMGIVSFDNPNAAITEINRWISEQTEGMISDLVRPDDLNPLTRLVIANAVYMKGEWESAFPKSQTRNGLFFPEAGDRRRVKMMSQSYTFPYRSRDDFRMLALPYRDRSASMIVVLPPRFVGKVKFAEFEKSMTAAAWKIGFDQLEMTAVNVKLPQLSLHSRFELREALGSLGVVSAFDKKSADFSGTVLSSNDSLFIAKVLHEAKIDVVEEGSVAAGATVVVEEKKDEAGAKGGGGTRLPDFFVTQPFLFAIRDDDTGAILFMGRVTELGESFVEKK